MGASFYFDKMLPTEDKDSKNPANNSRQLEVWRTGYKTFISIGILNQESSGERYTVELNCSELKEVKEAIESIMIYFGC